MKKKKTEEEMNEKEDILKKQNENLNDDLETDDINNDIDNIKENEILNQDIEDSDELLDDNSMQDEKKEDNETTIESIEQNTNTEEKLEKKKNKKEKAKRKNKDKKNDNSDNNDNNKQSETIFSKRVEIPLVGLILVVLIVIIIIISLIIFKDNIFNFKGFKDSNVYTNQISADNLLNEEEKIGFNLITKWLENYEGANMEITNKILSYKINSISLNSKKDDKFIILSTFDVVPASIDNTIWINDNGEKQGDTIKNKSMYFVIEKVQDNYEIVSTSASKPDINNEELTEEKAILLIKNDFSDSDKLNLSSDSSMIDSLDQSKKTEVENAIGEKLDNCFKITGSYRNTYFLGTILVNKNNKEKWFVDVSGDVTKLEKSTGILNVAEFEVQGDLNISVDQARLITIGSFPKNKRQAVSIAEDWTDNIKNKKEVEKQLGDLDDYYALKTKTSKGFIVIKKNGLTKDFVSSEGKVTNLLGVEDITTILE